MHYDLVVIGSGAGEGTVTHALAPTGARILLLERGGWMPQEPENWSAAAIWLDGRYRNSGQWMDGDTGKRFTPKPALLRRRQHQGLWRDPVP